MKPQLALLSPTFLSFLPRGRSYTGSIDREREQVDQEVGDAIRESGIPRSELFITSKFWPNFAAPENVDLCLQKVLGNMGLDYVDLFLAHFPIAFQPTCGLKEARSGPPNTMQQLGIQEDSVTKGPAVDWEHCSRPIAKAAGKTSSLDLTPGYF